MSDKSQKRNLILPVVIVALCALIIFGLMRRRPAESASVPPDGTEMTSSQDEKEGQSEEGQPAESQPAEGQPTENKPTEPPPGDDIPERAEIEELPAPESPENSGSNIQNAESSSPDSPNHYTIPITPERDQDSGGSNTDMFPYEEFEGEPDTSF